LLRGRLFLILKSRLIGRCAFALAAAAALLFLPAGTLRFWEAWVFLGIFFVPMVVFSVYYLKHDPALVERRLQSKEKIKEQKVVMKVANVVFVVAILIPGLDHRFGWPRELAGGVPLWLRIVAQALVLAGYVMTMWVIDVNRFASRTFQVEAGQKVISAGPYRMVRHPMYFGGLVMWLSVAPALGSYVALPFFALFIPVLVVRLLNEEKVLRQELPGYVGYSQKTRFRLVPYVW
jgi:protein-S-isoprenylcysteine O-methyltransferase Ste14